jgi:hypothetical protein
VAFKKWQLETFTTFLQEANEPSQDSPRFSMLLGAGTAVVMFAASVFTGTPWLIALVFSLICGSIAFAFGIYIILVGLVLGVLYLIWVAIVWLASITGGL